MQTVRKPPVIFFITGVITMKRLTIAMLSAITVCLFLAACKTNTDEKPESSQLSNPPASSSVVESSVMESSVQITVRIAVHPRDQTYFSVVSTV